jgi:hypothetical protein
LHSDVQRLEGTVASFDSSLHQVRVDHLNCTTNCTTIDNC